MPLWSVFLFQMALPPNPPAITAPPPCPTPPQYTYSDWEQTREERQFQGEWVVQYLHYSRTKSDECRETSTTQRKVEGPYRLWPAVPANRVADVNRPEGTTDSLSGSPLRSSSLPEYGVPGSVGPNSDLSVSKQPTVPANKQPAPEPFYPGFALFAGALVASLIFRRRRSKQDPVPSHAEELVQGPPVPRIEARTLDSMKKGDEWVPEPAEVAWLQAFFGLVEPNYGPLTKAAVAEFQRKHGITPDPKVMVGPNTYRVLWEEHINLVHEQWQGVVEGRSPLVLERVFDSPMPPDLREEMSKLNDAYAAYWTAVEGRYQAILRRDVDRVAEYDRDIQALQAGGIKVEDIPVLKAKYQPLIDGLYNQAEKVKKDANDGEYAKLLAMLAAADQGNWDEILTAKATAGGRWGAFWSRDASEQKVAESVVKHLDPFVAQVRPGVSVGARLGTSSPSRSENEPVREESRPVLASKQFWTLALPLSNAKLTTAYDLVDASHPSGHTGIDLVPTSSNETILAAAAGTVVLAKPNGNYGNCVIIDHHNGYFTVYGHLKSISVKEGDSVNSGDDLGLMGDTGRSEGAHLHLELRTGKWNAEAKDPLSRLGMANPWLFLETKGWGANFRRLIEDSEFKDTSISLDEIRTVLRRSPTFKDYADGASFPVYVQKQYGAASEDSGRRIDIAKVIYDAARNAQAKDGSRGINPLLLLARMEVEYSLLTEGFEPSDEAVVWALGYGAPDSGDWDYRHTGLDYQIQRAATRLAELFHDGDKLSPPKEIDDGPVLFTDLQPQGVYGGEVENRTTDATVIQGNIPTIIPRHIGVENRATWALYQYTPHMVDLHLLAKWQHQKEDYPDWYSAERESWESHKGALPPLTDNAIGGGNLRFVRVWNQVKGWIGR